MPRITGETFFELSQSLRHYRVSCELFDTNLPKLIDEKDRESQLSNPLSTRSWRVSLTRIRVGLKMAICILNTQNHCT
jgi:hypothetical protein